MKLNNRALLGVLVLGLLVVGTPLVLLVLDARPSSFRSRFARDRDALLARPVPPPPPVTDTDLASLPPLMQTYLRRVGAVGQPRIHSMRVLFNAQMRSTATSPWMRSTATQTQRSDPPGPDWRTCASHWRSPAYCASVR